MSIVVSENVMGMVKNTPLWSWEMASEFNKEHNVQKMNIKIFKAMENGCWISNMAMKYRQSPLLAHYYLNKSRICFVGWRKNSTGNGYNHQNTISIPMQHMVEVQDEKKAKSMMFTSVNAARVIFLIHDLADRSLWFVLSSLPCMLFNRKKAW